MSEILSIKLRVGEKLAKTLRSLNDLYDIDIDVIDLREENVNKIMSVEEASRLGYIIGELLDMIVLIKEKSQSTKN